MTHPPKCPITGTYSSTPIASIPHFPPYTPRMNKNMEEFRPPTTMYAPPRIRSQSFITLEPTRLSFANSDDFYVFFPIPYV